MVYNEPDDKVMAKISILFDEMLIPELRTK
jgi:hypothetical protein